MPTQNTVEDLRRLRDEIRLKMHLAEMEAAQVWESVEPQLERLEASIEENAGKAAETASILVDELAEAFRRMRDRLG